MKQHRRRSPCCADEARRYLASESELHRHENGPEHRHVDGENPHQHQEMEAEGVFWTSGPVVEVKK